MQQEISRRIVTPQTQVWTGFPQKRRYKHWWTFNL